MGDAILAFLAPLGLGDAPEPEVREIPLRRSTPAEFRARVLASDLPPEFKDALLAGGMRPET